MCSWIPFVRDSPTLPASVRGRSSARRQHLAMAPYINSYLMVPRAVACLAWHHYVHVAPHVLRAHTHRRRISVLAACKRPERAIARRSELGGVAAQGVRGL